MAMTLFEAADLVNRIRGFKYKPLVIYPWAGGQTLTIASNVATGSLVPGFYRVQNLGDAVVWVRGDGAGETPTPAAADDAACIPLQPGQTEYIYATGFCMLAGTDGDKVNLHPAVID